MQDHPATLLDLDGSQITIQIAGPGTAWADVQRGRLSLSFSGGTSDTTLSIDVTGGDGRALTRLVRIRGPVGTIDAPRLELRGTFSAKTIDHATFLAISYADIQTGWIGSLTTRRIDHSRIESDRLGQITVNGNIDASRIFVSPANDRPVALESVKIKGEMTNSSIFALGDIGTVTAAVMLDSNVTAGVRIDENSTDEKLVQPLPDRREEQNLYNFTGKYQIEQVIVNGKTDRMIAFSNTIIAAYQIGDVTLFKVDGFNDPTGKRPLFGVAGYRVGHVKRTFDAMNTGNNQVSDPLIDFKVRQIKQPLIFDPGIGSYGGFPSSGAGTISGGIWGSGNGYSVPEYVPIDGTPIGSVRNHAATDVYLAHSGRYELRDSSGDIVLSALTLGALAAELFRRSNTSIKVEQPSNGSMVTILATSTGPALELFANRLGDSVVSAFDAEGQPTYSTAGQVSIYDLGGLVPNPPPIVNYPPIDSTQTRVIPSSTVLTSQLGSAARVPFRVFTRSLFLVKDEPAPIGKVVSALGQHNVGMAPSFEFASDSHTSTELGLALANLGADRVGSRRLPARWVPSRSSNVIVYGLPNGGTAVIPRANLDTSALNAVGDLKALPTADELKQSLISQGIKFAD